MSTGVKITGFKEIDRKLSNLKQMTQHKIIGSAIYQAAKPLEEAQKHILASKTKRKTGNLNAAIGRMRVSLKKANEIGTVKVGPRIGGRYKGYHGHLIEFGTKPRYTKTGKYTGRGPKLPYIEPAYNREIGRVKTRIEQNLNKVFNRWVKTGKIIEIDVD